MYALVVIWYTLEFMVCIIAMILHAESFGQNVDYRWKINGSNMSLDLYEKCPVFRKQLCILVRFGQIWYQLFWYYEKIGRAALRALHLCVVVARDNNN